MSSSSSKPKKLNHSDKPYMQARAGFRASCEKVKAVCHLCGQGIQYGPDSLDPFELDHFYPVSTHPGLYLDRGNFRPAHSSCNRSRGNKDVTPVLGRPSEQW